MKKLKLIEFCHFQFQNKDKNKLIMQLNYGKLLFSHVVMKRKEKFILKGLIN